MNDLSVPGERYEAIAAVIASDTSPVGIDAAKTHVIILHKLEQIERRLERLERHVSGQTP